MIAFLLSGDEWRTIAEYAVVVIVGGWIVGTLAAFWIVWRSFGGTIEGSPLQRLRWRNNRKRAYRFRDR